MKTLIFAFAILAFCIGWGADHFRLEALYASKQRELIAKSHDAEIAKQEIDGMTDAAISQNKELQDSEKHANSDDSLIEKMNEDWQAQLCARITEDQDKYNDLKNKYADLSDQYAQVWKIGKSNYDAAVYWDGQATIWRKRTTYIVAQIRAQQNSFTTSFNPDAISNPAVREMFEPPTQQSAPSAPITPTVIESPFFPESTTTIDPQTGDVQINEH